MQNPYDISVLDPSVDPFNAKKKSNSRNSVSSTTGRGVHFLPKVRRLLKGKSSWGDIKEKKTITSSPAGFSENNGKLMFTQDFKTLPYAAKNRVHFISEDNQLTTRGSQKQKVLTEVDGVETEVFVKRGPCEGVKVCSADNCGYTVANTQLRNKCVEHGFSKALTRTGKCPIHFLYISGPLLVRMIADGSEFFSAEGEDKHNHARPTEHKISRKVVEDIQQTVQQDITKSSKDLLKGNCLLVVLR